MCVSYVTDSRYGLGANGLKTPKLAAKKIVSSYYNGNLPKGSMFVREYVPSQTLIGNRFGNSTLGWIEKMPS